VAWRISTPAARRCQPRRGAHPSVLGAYHSARPSLLCHADAAQRQGRLIACLGAISALFRRRSMRAPTAPGPSGPPSPAQVARETRSRVASIPARSRGTCCSTSGPESRSSGRSNAIVQPAAVVGVAAAPPRSPSRGRARPGPLGAAEAAAAAPPYRADDDDIERRHRISLCGAIAAGCHQSGCGAARASSEPGATSRGLREPAAPGTTSGTCPSAAAASRPGCS
jgi:hypothetical protein